MGLVLSHRGTHVRPDFTWKRLDFGCQSDLIDVRWHARQVPYICKMFVVVAFCRLTPWGSAGICSCALTNACCRVRGLHVWPFLKFHFYPATWAATRRLRRICLHFFRVDAVRQGAYHGWRKSQHSCAVHKHFHVTLPQCSCRYQSVMTQPKPGHSKLFQKQKADLLKIKKLKKN